MGRIWKYELIITQEQKIKVPKKSILLKMACQNGTPCLWYLVKDEEINNEPEVKTVYIYGTGHEFYNIGLRYIDSFLAHNDSFVGHVFIKE